MRYVVLSLELCRDSSLRHAGLNCGQHQVDTTHHYWVICPPNLGSGAIHGSLPGAFGSPKRGQAKGCEGRWQIPIIRCFPRKRSSHRGINRRSAD
jgi:hypothetical protein